MGAYGSLCGYTAASQNLVGFRLKTSSEIPVWRSHTGETEGEAGTVGSKLNTKANSQSVDFYFKLRDFHVFPLRDISTPSAATWLRLAPPINTGMRQLPVLETAHAFFLISPLPHVPLFSISLLFFCPSAPSPPGLFLSPLKTLTYIYLHTQERSCPAPAFSQQCDAALLLWDTRGFMLFFFFCDPLPHDWLPCGEDREAILCPVASAGSPF